MAITDNIKRWWQSKGFGVQSKSDFAFLHDVIRERLPYYAYEDLQRQHPSEAAERQQVARLIMRMANHLQPTEVRMHGNDTALMADAVTKGCSKTVVRQCDSSYIRLGKEGTAAHIEHGTMVEYVCGTKIAQGGADAVVLTGINGTNTSLWQQLLTADAITFDLRHTGIALFCKGRYPEHYAINP